MSNVWSFDGKVMIAGVPIARMPNSVREFPDFLTWWNTVGRLNRSDYNGWSSISGPGVMRNRTEMVPPQVWDALPLAERELITKWAEDMPIRIFYD
jgi:hypothetical protein